ncbi:MAG: MFS transporter [Clostridiales Family XIII bacterium]|jgi:MFS family permease|nr:MFS transporter [Clostridiales Family XIII bacterium]
MQKSPSAIWSKITIILLSFAIMSDMVVIPAIGGIYGTFYDANAFLLNFVLSGAMLMNVVGAIVGGFLVRVFSKKHLIMASYVLVILSGLFGAAIDNIYYVVAMRVIIGFSYGLAATAITGLIAAVFTDEKERSFVMGSYFGIASLWGLIMSVISGFLAVTDWHHSFYVYLLAVPILALAAAFLPKTPPEGKEKDGLEQGRETSVAGGGDREKLPLRFLPAALACVILFTLYFIVVYLIAVYVQEEQLGDSSTAGLLDALIMIGVVVACLLFSAIYMRIRRAVIVIAFLVLAVCYLVLSFSNSVWLSGLMCLFVGASYGLGVSYYMMYASTTVSPRLVSMALGIMNANIGLAGFFSVYVSDLYRTVFNAESLANSFLYVGLTLLICAVLSFVLALRAKKTSTGL